MTKSKMDINYYDIWALIIAMLMFIAYIIYKDRQHARETAKHNVDKQITYEREKTASQTCHRALDIVESSQKGLLVELQNNTRQAPNREHEKTVSDATSGQRKRVTRGTDCQTGSLKIVDLPNLLNNGKTIASKNQNQTVSLKSTLFDIISTYVNSYVNVQKNDISEKEEKEKEDHDDRLNSERLQDSKIESSGVVEAAQSSDHERQRTNPDRSSPCKDTEWTAQSMKVDNRQASNRQGVRPKCPNRQIVPYITASSHCQKGDVQKPGMDKPKSIKTVDNKLAESVSKAHVSKDNDKDRDQENEPRPNDSNKTSCSGSNNSKMRSGKKKKSKKNKKHEMPSECSKEITTEPGKCVLVITKPGQHIDCDKHLHGENFRQKYINGPPPLSFSETSSNPITECTQDSPETPSLDSFGNDGGKMKCAKSGKVLIVNNFDFEGMSQRRGANKDMVAIENMLVGKGWKQADIISHENLSAEDIKTQLSNLKQYGRLDRVMVFLLSHGEYGVIYGSDGLQVDIQEEILEPLSEEKCEEFRGVPKLFFLQSCQEEVNVANVDEQNSENNQSDSNERDQDDQMAEQSQDDDPYCGEFSVSDIESPLENDSPKRIPCDVKTRTNMLIAYSCKPGLKSLRLVDKGSLFIQELTKKFATSDEDVVSVLVDVKHSVHSIARKYGTFQSPFTEDYLSQPCYL